jgi:catechol 2,3-dioxygenase-like lactoylglutathione lyase family enzyme
VEVERVDFVSVHSQDIERSKAFYAETLGLPVDKDRGGSGFEVFAGQLCLSVWNPANAGLDASPSKSHIALNVGDVAAGRAELESRGVEFEGDIFDSGVCHMAFFSDPDGNALMLHRRYAP